LGVREPKEGGLQGWGGDRAFPPAVILEVSVG
jgi:hypothetical protein